MNADDTDKAEWLVSVRGIACPASRSHPAHFALVGLHPCSSVSIRVHPCSKGLRRLNSMLSPSRLEPLLDEPLRRAGGEHRPRARRDLAHVAPGEGAAPAGPGVVRAPQHHRHALPVLRPPQHGVRARGAALHGAGPGEPVLDLLLRPPGARERARRARLHHLRDVGGAQRHLARDAADGRGADERARHLGVLRLGEGEEPPLPRRDLRHDAPRRRLPASRAWARTSSAPTRPRASST